MPLWRDGEEGRVEACRVGRDCELRVSVGVRWKEEEDRVPCDLERCSEARDADAPRGVLIPAAEHGRGGGVSTPGKILQDSLLS
jgi:hypothetical protein